MNEAWRNRRTAYSSGRKEVIGYEGNTEKRKTRKVKKKTRSKLAFTPMRGKFRWLKH
jgi:hypothetical protein